MIIVTGGAGFIGSVLVAELNRRGRRDIYIVDDVDHPEKKHNLAVLEYEKLVGITDFRKELMAGTYDASGVEAIFHLGACSSTTESNWDYLLDTNVEYSKDIISWSVAHNVRCVYASSAATYGNGAHGYSDAHDLFTTLTPLNLYGKSKLDVDVWALAEGHLEKVVGVRYFNVYGPNEFHKEGMRSLVAKKFEDVVAGKGIELFKSYNPDYKDGEQVRDFVYVRDVVAMTLFFLDNPTLAGIFNIGTGKAESWNSLAEAMFAAVGQPKTISYVDMPDILREQYQYFTEADMTKLKAAGWTTEPTPITDAVREYIQNHLIPHTHVGLGSLT
jgi:ADP-L-glycero-D-manno-heptose 6-epimerase